MEARIRTALEAKGLADATIRNYMNALINASGQSSLPPSLHFLRDVPAVLNRLAAYKPATAESAMGAILSVLNALGARALANKYYPSYATARAGLEAVADERTPSQVANWPSEADIAAVTAATAHPTSWDGELDRLLVGLYTLQPPRRNADFAEMWVVRGDAPSDASRNWLEWWPRRRAFVYHVYKTAATYGTQVVPVRGALADLLTAVLGRHPQRAKHAFPLLVRADGTRLTAAAIPVALNRLFGKRVGSSLLRAAYLTRRYAPTAAAMAADAAAMAHSVATQQGRYVKRR